MSEKWLSRLLFKIDGSIFKKRSPTALFLYKMSNKKGRFSVLEGYPVNINKKMMFSFVWIHIISIFKLDFKTKGAFCAKVFLKDKILNKKKLNKRLLWVSLHKYEFKNIGYCRNTVFFPWSTNAPHPSLLIFLFYIALFTLSMLHRIRIGSNRVRAPCRG